MSDLSKHFKKLKTLTKLYEVEVEAMCKEGHLEKNMELEIELGAVLFNQNEALKNFKENKNV